MSTTEQLQAAAAREAEALSADFIGIEHLFLAWLGMAQGGVVEALRELGLTERSFREQLASSSTGKRRGPPPSEKGTISSQARRVLELAEEQATAAGRPEATLDDLVFAMIREPRGAIARAFTEFKVKPSKLRPLAEGGAPPKPRKPAAEQESRRPSSRSTPPAPEGGRPSRESRSSADRPRGRRDPEIDNIPERRPPERPRLQPPPKPVRPPRPEARKRRWVLSLLLLAVPLSAVAWWQGMAPTLVFVTSAVAVLPLAMLMGEATSHLAERSGPSVGGLLNATFGNAAELIIALVALRAGYVDLVKATITGSILGNLLLILGLSLFVGGLRKPLLTFNRTAAGMSSAMLALAVAGLVFPGLFHLAHPNAAATEVWLSELVSIVLLVSYAASLIFVLRTHRPLFGGGGEGHVSGPVWGLGKALAVLGVATIGVALESELLVHGLESATAAWGLTPVFLGLIALPMIGNAAEHGTAVVAAAKGQTELALQIALGSSTQVALLIAPVVVFAGAAMGVGMNLLFSPFEVMALALAVGVSSLITLDGESHWFEGVQLLALYALIGVAAWLI